MFHNHGQSAYDYRDRQYIPTYMGNTSPVADRVRYARVPKQRFPKDELLKIAKLLTRIASFRFPVLRMFI